MKNSISLDLAKKIMGDNIIGPDELTEIKDIRLDMQESAYEIPFSEDELKAKSSDYYLIYGASKFDDGRYVNIQNLKLIFGADPDVKTPCFYFQDWYEKEDFIQLPMEEGWFFIRKNVYENSRAVQPDELQKQFSFPKAITCTYAFIVAWLAKNEKLWYHDFVWCCDKDHNGDRIYVGKYNDVDGVNRDGFSIHRHLALRDCYACVD